MAKVRDQSFVLLCLNASKIVDNCSENNIKGFVDKYESFIEGSSMLVVSVFITAGLVYLPLYVLLTVFMPCLT